MKSDPTLWLLARSSGLVAYALLTASVLAGLIVKARPLGTSVRPAAVVDVHRFLALLGLGALVLHGAALVLDDAVDIGLAALLVPGASPYRPLATALGVLAAHYGYAQSAGRPAKGRVTARPTAPATRHPRVAAYRRPAT